MTRINDSPNQSVEQLKATTQQLALRVNQLERLLDGKEIDEVNFLDGMAHQRKTKFSLSNGMMKTDWKETDIAATATGGIDTDYIYVGGIEYTPGANPNSYKFLQVGADGSSSWIPAMISPMPTGYEIYNVTKNHIHLPGETAGNI